MQAKKGSHKQNSLCLLIAVCMTLTVAMLVFAANNPNQAWKSISSEDLNIDANHGTRFDFNYTKVKWDGNVMPDGEIIKPDKTQPAAGLVGYWKLDSNFGAVAVDSSGQGNDGTWKAGADSNGSWFFDQNAAAFDGENDYIDFGNMAAFKIATKTISFWLNLKSTSNDMVFSSGGANYYIKLSTNDNVTISWANSSGSQVLFTTTSNFVESAGTWAHYAVVFDVQGDDVTVTIYKNGQAVDSTQSSAGYSTTYSTAFEISRYAGTGTLFLDAYLADVKFFNCALSQEEIANEYARNKRSQGLKLYYNFNDTNASGEAIADQAGFDQNGILQKNVDVNAWGLWDTNALHLDGATGYLDVNHHLDLNFDNNGTYTWSAWVYRKGNAKDNGIFGKGLPGVRGYGVSINDANKLAFTDLKNADEKTGNTAIDVNSWTHIAISYNGLGTATFYVNGTDDGSGTVDPTDDEVTDLNIGMSDANYFDGYIDELKFFDINLTAVEIAADYNAWKKADYYSQTKDMNWTATIQGISWDALFGSEQLTKLNTDKNLIAWFRFNDNNSEGNLAKNDANREFDGMLRSGADLNGTGWDDSNAAYFDGVNDHITLGLHTEYQFTNTTDFTLSAWAFLTDTGRARIIHIVSGAPFYHGYSLRWEGTLWQFVIETNTSNFLNVTAPISDPLNQWAHVVGTYDSSTRTASIYVNGVLEGSDTNATFGDFSTGTNLYISAQWTNQFEGFIDEVRIYDRTLRPDEIRTLYAAGLNDINVSVRVCDDPSCSGLNDGNWAEFDLGNRYHSLDTNLGLQVDLNFNDTNSDGSGILDASEQGNHGLLINEADINAVGKDKSRAGYFNGLDDTSLGTCVDLGSDAFGIDDTNEFTIALWAKVYRHNTAQAYNTIFRRDRFGRPISLDYGSGRRIRLLVSCHTTGGYLTVPLAFAFTYNEWFHVAYTFKPGLRVAYINGAEAASDSPTGDLKYLDNLAYRSRIGCAAPGFDHMAGEIDEFKLYNRALSAGEITGLYLKGNPMKYVQYKAEFEHSDVNFPIGYGYLNDVGVEYNTVPDANISAVDKNSVDEAFPWYSYSNDGNLTIDFNVTDLENYDPKTGEIFYSTTNDYGQSTKIAGNLKLDGNNCQTNFTDLNSDGGDLNLIGYWKFNGHDGNQIHAADSSWKQNHGQYISGADNNTQGKWDTNAAFFDGVNDRLRVAIVDGNNSLEGTYTFWIYPLTMLPDSAGLVTSVSQSPIIHIDIVSGQMRIRASIQDQGNTTVIDVTAATSIATKTWTHYALTFNSSGGKAYLNGALSAEDTSGASAYKRTPELLLATDRLIGGRYSNTYLEELKVYDKALTAEQISWDYNYGLQNKRKCSQDWNTINLSDSNYYVGIQVNDSVGNSDFNTTANPLGIDNNSAVTIDNDYNNTWQNTDQNIQLSCTDTGGSGCKNLYYGIVNDDNYQAKWGVGDVNIGISNASLADGNYAIFYWSDDLEDHNETAHLIYLAVDQTAPTASITSPTTGSSQTSATVTLEYTGLDATSDINRYWVKVDSGSWTDNSTDTSYSFTSQTEGSHTYYVKSEDNAGNESTEASVSVTIGNTTTTGDTTAGDSLGYSGTPAYPGKSQEGCVEEGYLCRAGRTCCPDLECTNDRCKKKTCQTDKDCDEGQKCINLECTNFFQLKIQRADTPIDPGETLDFTYIAKNLTSESAEVEISYSLDSNTETIASGSETLSIEAGQEKENQASLQLPKNKEGNYTLTIELAHDNKTTTATKQIQIEKGAALKLDLAISRLPSTIKDQPIILSITIGTNKDQEIQTKLNQVILKENQIAWNQSQQHQVTVTKKLEQSFPILSPGQYTWIITATSGNTMEKIIRKINIEAPTSPTWRILTSKPVLYSATGLILAILVILAWHSLIIAKKLSPEHPARRKAKALYAIAIIIAALILLIFTAYMLQGQLQQLAEIQITVAAETGQGQLLLSIAEAIKNSLAGPI